MLHISKSWVDHLKSDGGGGVGGRLSVSIARAYFHSNAYFFSCLTLYDFFVLFSPPQPCHLSNGLALTVADLGEGPRGFRPPPFGALFAKYL